jgi:hypothetical protein
MKYLCTLYLEPNALQGLSAGELAKLNRDSLDYNDELAKKRALHCRVGAAAADDRKDGPPPRREDPGDRRSVCRKQGSPRRIHFN